MRAEVVSMTADNLDMEAIRRGGDILKQGGLVAFPTETVYGLGGDALNPQASKFLTDYCFFVPETWNFSDSVKL